MLSENRRAAGKLAANSRLLRRKGHHKYFRWNFGGYTTIWNRLCGTMRGKFESDFATMKARVGKEPSPAVTVTQKISA